MQLHFRSLLTAGTLAALLALLSACQYSPAPPREGAILLPVRLFPDDGEQCGPASLAGVLSYWGKPCSQEEIAKEIYSKSAGGTLTQDMLWYAREKGLAVEQVSGSRQQLRACIDAGIPVIVMIDFGRGIISFNHFMVITGYDEDGVYANSTVYQNQRFSSRKFDQVWSPHDNWMMIAAPADKQLPDITLDPVTHLKRGFALERKGDEEGAMRHYRLAAEQKRPEAYLMIGNFYYQRNKLEEAEEAYRQVLELKPADANAMNNLASTLLASGKDLQEAEALARQAIAINPNSPNSASYRQTLEKIQSTRSQQSVK